MNFSFLPNKIKKELTKIAADKEPIAIARSSASKDAKPGESYIVAYKDKVFIFSRELGDDNYSQLADDIGNIPKIEVNKDGINTMLDLDLGNQEFSMKFSSFEEKNLHSIVEEWASKKGNVTVNAATLPSENEVSEETVGTGEASDFSHIVGLAAAMMYIASIDDDISKEEDYYIIAMMGNDNSVLQTALAYYKTHTFEQLLQDLKGVNDDQKLCILANMMELGMKDGILHSSELNLMQTFSKNMNITQDQYDTIKQVLLIKNKISVLNT